MLIYANNLLLNPEHSPDKIIHLVAKWIGNRARSFIDPLRLAEGIHELKLKDGITVRSRTTYQKNNSRSHPFLFSAQLTHPDNKTPGRRWTTEIGMSQAAIGDPISFSILLKTDEIGALVNTPVQATRPNLIKQLVKFCHPAFHTPGLKAKRLTEESAPAFLNEIDRKERNYPIAILSTNQDGKYPIEPEKLKSALAGLADVVYIPASENTYSIEKLIGRRFMAFGGAINIVFPGRNREEKVIYDTTRIDPEKIEELVAENHRIDSEVLAKITYRTNIPLSRNHISPEKVSESILRSKLAVAIEESKTNKESKDASEYIDLLKVADEIIKSKEEENENLNSKCQEKDEIIMSLESDIANLKYALSGAQSQNSESNSLSDAIAHLRDNIQSVLDGAPKLLQVIELISTLYSDRVVFLKSAKSSAKESDRSGFKKGKKAFELLSKLSTDYWKCLANGESEQRAKAAFGHNAYANNEANALSAEGKKRRTFSYNGQEILMEKHIKDGVKDSVADTLRVHFEWIASEKKIIIGHCGKHLNF